MGLDIDFVLIIKFISTDHLIHIPISQCLQSVSFIYAFILILLSHYNNLVSSTDDFIHSPVDTLWWPHHGHPSPHCLPSTPSTPECYTTLHIIIYYYITSSVHSLYPKTTHVTMYLEGMDGQKDGWTDRMEYLYITLQLSLTEYNNNLGFYNSPLRPFLRLHPVVTWP